MTAPVQRNNPYVGLPPFQEEDALYFYGREPQTAALLDILRQHRFLGVLGSSGSGKSSLVRAGLLPALRGGFLVDERDAWHIATMRPGAAPYENLCAQLLQALDEPAGAEAAAALAQDLRDRHLDALLDFLKPRLRPNANLLLVVDQFEEIFAYRGRDRDESSDEQSAERRRKSARRRAEAAEFVDLLLALGRQQVLPVYLVLTMRTDFLGDCDLFYGLPEALNQGRFLVPRMGREQLRDAVECPALLMGASVSPRLTDHVLNELGDRFDRLPVLQHALLRTWDAWDAQGRIGPLDLHHFNDGAGGLDGALDKDAENALKTLEDQAGAVQRVFQRLTKTDHARRRLRNPTRTSKLMAAAGVHRATVDRIVAVFQGEGRNFLFSADDGQPDDPRIDIAHESLIRQWKTLSRWVDEEALARDEYLELVAKARKHELGRALPLQGPELQLALEWRERVAPTPSWAERYSAGEGDFTRMLKHLGEGLAARRNRDAEQEWGRAWARWAGLLIAVALIFGLLLLDWKMLDRASLVEAIVALRGDGKLVTTLDGFVNWLDRLAELSSNLNLLILFVFLGVFLWAFVKLKHLHRRLALPRIHERIIGLEELRQGPPALLEVAGRPGRPPYADWKARLRGFLFDASRQSVVMAICYGLIFWLVDIAQDLGWDPTDQELQRLSFSFFAAMLALNLWLAVRPLVLNDQATWGMRRAGVYRTDLFGRRLTPRRATLWYLSRIPCFLLCYGFGFLTQPFTPRRQTAADWLGSTVVLVGKPPADEPQA